MCKIWLIQDIGKQTPGGDVDTMYVVFARANVFEERALAWTHAYAYVFNKCVQTYTKRRSDN